MNILSFAVTCALLLCAPNPVLPGTNDVGVLRHAGKYYLMGMGTSGGIYVSGDLSNWSGPHHAFSMENAWTEGPSATDENIHACDLVLLNGVFHLYWSVNHGELRQIGHAVGDNPLGPYREPAHDVPFDGRIDPQCFQDADGRLYFYTVKFGMGNIIWGQPMADPWTLTDKPVRLLTPSRDTWETLDQPPQFVNEGPFVVRHRDRYYMVYNANHTSRQFGNYALGVAEADTPLGFKNAGKYPFPVLRSNRDPKHEGVTPEPDTPEVKNCGQPNLVRGPNGIEWWLVYFADQQRRAQYIDRAHFFGRELYIEGPTLAEIPGYQPVPAIPSFWDLFDGSEPLDERWSRDGAWQKENGVLRAAGEEGAVFARTKMADAAHYVSETVLRHGGGGAGRLGVAAWRGNDLLLLAGLDRADNTAFLNLCPGGTCGEERVSLPPDFNWDGPHTLRVENNAGQFAVHLGAVLLKFTGARTEKNQPVQAGLFAEGCAASFDSFLLTHGWEEWGAGIRGWETREGREQKGGKDGLALAPGESVFKGGLPLQYEFSLQVRSEGVGGVYPVYRDEDNYACLTFDRDFTTIRFSGRRHGQPQPSVEFSVRKRIHRAHDAAVNGDNLRVVKFGDRLILFAEGYELGTIMGDWPVSRAGLFAEKGRCAFDGITLYELP
ncbi:MAG: family 43 glycosylhydrolase [Candidatus Hydrogenedens sp.]|nr:family 43 glycosylhydrolase [Candidatus Hydrogenedentota bacterium]NLF58671.1 family 43 glycosylhydrolase [Candidatus Hydrogenedens sp.]